MTIISESYREQNRLLHESNPGYGAGGSKWAPYIDRMMREERFSTALDFGCGKGFLARDLKARGIEISEYDPAIPGKDGEPQPAELVICTDVLEHVEREHLGSLLRRLASLTKRRLFFNIATRKASKNLPDGRNAHLIVKPAEWWRKKIAQHFHITLWNVRPEAGCVFGEAVPLDLWAKYESYRKGRKRRPLTPEWAMMFDHIRTEMGKYADAFTRVDTIRMWEDCDDEPADMQVACNILEHVPDVHLAIRSMLRLAHKAIMATIVLDPQRDEAHWRGIFEQHIRISDWQCHDGALVVIGSPKVDVQGVTAVGVVESEKRFEQVRQAVKRFSKRIDPAPAHDRRAIIACYGPSLASTIERLRKERDETGGVVVSVSGSHDFLLDHGIVPDYHVECDPRSHKADNIAKGHPGVVYLLGSVCHPVLFDKLEAAGCDIRLWHVATPEHTVRIIDELGEKREHVVSGGGSVGLRSIPLLYAMGYRDLSIFGMDCSFSDDGSKQWAGKHAGKRQDLCQVKCGDRIFTSSPILLTYATNFWETVQKVDDLSVRLFGDGLLQYWANGWVGAVPFVYEAAA